VKILVIEDNSVHAKLAHAVLDAAGHEVMVADSAAPALQAIQEQRPELILVDLDLPGENGLELTRRLKGAAATADICVVAVTAYPGKYSKLEALAAACDAYFVKPINTRTLARDLAALTAPGPNGRRP